MRFSFIPIQSRATQQFCRRNCAVMVTDVTELCIMLCQSMYKVTAYISQQYFFHKFSYTSFICSSNEANIRMRSHGLRQLVDDKSIASCQQTCCKLIVKTCYPQACYKLFQQVVTSLQMTSCNKPDFNRRVVTW